MNYHYAKLFLAVAILCTASIAIGQPTLLWDKTLGGSGDDVFRDATASSDGGFVLVGESNSNISGEKSENSQGSFDFWMVKTDANGSPLWDKTFGGSGTEIVTAITPTADGGYLLGGLSTSGISGDKTDDNRGGEDYWVVKTDADGNLLWDKTYGGSGNDRLEDITPTVDGGYLLAGSSSSSISGEKSDNSRGSRDYWVIKIDANGNLLWDKTFGGSSDDALAAVAVAADGGYLLAGLSRSNMSGEKSENSRGSWDYWVVKIDADGNLLWDKTYGGSSQDQLFSAAPSTDEGFFLGGWSTSGANGEKSENGRGGQDYWIVKIDTDGTLLWDKTFGGSGNDAFGAGTAGADGCFFGGGASVSGISGDKSEGNQGGQDYWVVKVDTNGNLLWDKTYGGSGNDEVGAIIANTTSFLVGGRSSSGISGDKSENSRGQRDFWVIKGDLQKQSVTSFTLVNAKTNTDIVELTEGMQLKINTIPHAKLNIRANTDPPIVGSVFLQLSGPFNESRTENAVPYALFGDNKGDYNKHNLRLGDYTITATPYTKANKKGEQGTSLSLSFSIVSNRSGNMSTAAEEGTKWIYDKEGKRPLSLPQELRVYPNPFTQTFTIRAADFRGEMAEVHLFDLYGKSRLVKNVAITSGVAEIDVAQINLGAGTYLLQVIWEDRVEMRKIIKNDE